MRRASLPLLAAALLLALGAAGPSRPREHARVQPTPHGGPPHAWLYGVWTGGLFPVVDGMLAQDCATQATAGFAQDSVAHTTLVTNAMIRRVIETVRSTPAGTEFRFTPDAADPVGFGCASADDLSVERAGPDAIRFPHCSGFPYQLKRCQPQAR